MRGVEQGDESRRHSRREHQQPADRAAGQRDDPAIGVFAEELRRALDAGITPAVRVPRAEALAMCETALLSSRTGNPEHTHTMMNITGARQR